MRAATRKKLIKALGVFETLLVKCGGEGGTPGPCPSGKKPKKTKDRDLEDETKKALAWVADQDPWHGKVDTRVGSAGVKELAGDIGVDISEKTVKKYEKILLKEIESGKGIQRPFVVSRRETDGKLFLHDGNHQHRALRRLAREGLIAEDAVRQVPIVAVIPKSGYKFQTDFGILGNRMSEALVEAGSA